MLTIVNYKDIPLGKDCQIDSQVELDKLAKLGCDLIRCAIENNGVGLSAVQCGIPLNAFVMKSQSPYAIEEQLFGMGTSYTTYSMFVNCSYKPAENSPEVQSIEGCLSLGKAKYRVKRYMNIKLEGYLIGPDIDSGQILAIPINMVIDNPYDSAIMAHEIDHQNGILISDIGE